MPSSQRKISEQERAQYFRTLPDSIIDRQLARAEEKHVFEKAQAEKYRRKYKEPEHLLALRAEKRRRDESARAMQARLAR